MLLLLLLLLFSWLLLVLLLKLNNPLNVVGIAETRKPDFETWIRLGRIRSSGRHAVTHVISYNHEYAVYYNCPYLLPNLKFWMVLNRPRDNGRTKAELRQTKGTIEYESGWPIRRRWSFKFVYYNGMFFFVELLLMLLLLCCCCCVVVVVVVLLFLVWLLLLFSLWSLLCC